jgi:hypothetical protein
VASDVLAGFYIKYCPGIVFVMARPFFINLESKNLHNVPSYCWAMPMVVAKYQQYVAVQKAIIFAPFSLSCTCNTIYHRMNQKFEKLC